MSGQYNSGVVNYGTLQAEAVAGGENARAIVTHSAAASDGAKSIDDLRTQIDSLLALLREHKDHVPPDAEKAIEVVKQETAKAAPNKLVVSSILDSVKEAVKTVGSVAGAITAVKELAALVL